MFWEMVLFDARHSKAQALLWRQAQKGPSEVLSWISRLSG